MAADPSAYQHALGKSFNDLPPVLRAFAGSGKARYAGVCTVTRGSTAWSRIVGFLMGLPGKVSQADFSLDVDHAAHRCIWIRHFAGRKKLKTTIRSGGKPGKGLMVETVGAASLTFRVTVDDGRLLLQSLKGRFLGLPLPGFLGPRTEASVACEGETVFVESTVTMGRRTRLMRYSFEVTRAEEAAADRTVKPGGVAAATPALDTATAEEADAGDSATVVLAKGKSAAGDKTAGVSGAGALEAGEPQSQKAPRPAAAGDRTVPFSEAEQRGLKAEIAEAKEVTADPQAGDAPSKDTLAAAPAEEASPAEPVEGNSQLQPHPLDSDRATVPISASKVRKIPRRKKAADGDSTTPSGEDT